MKYGVVKEGAKHKVGIFLSPTFAMLPYVSAIEPLRAANRFSDQPLYSWHNISIDGDRVAACNGMQQEVEYDISSAHNFDTLLVCGPHDPLHYRDKRVFNWLNRQASKTSRIGAMDTGSFLLARAGLLNNYRCTVHWENQPGLTEEFPQLHVSTELFEIDRDRLTCAGGTAALDMMLNMVEQEHGRELASKAAELFIHGKIRKPNEPQRTDLCIRTGINQPRLLDSIAIMEANIEQPLQTSEIADAIGISIRQLERLFQRYLNTTPSNYYVKIRLNHSYHLLEQTSMSIIEVAIASGFCSAGHFSQRFRSMFSVRPSDIRNRRQG